MFLDMYRSLWKPNTAREENPHPNYSAVIVGLLKFWMQKIAKIFLHKCKTDNSKKLSTSCHNNLVSPISKKQEQHKEFREKTQK